MPVEIREIVIRTTLESPPVPVHSRVDALPEVLRQELLDACERMIREARYTMRRER